MLVSIQGLILCKEPYFNEAGYESLRTSPEARDNARLYHEAALLRTVASMTAIACRPPETFASIVALHCKATRDRLLGWLNSLLYRSEQLKIDFALLPLSDGFKVALAHHIPDLRAALERF